MENINIIVISLLLLKKEGKKQSKWKSILSI